jgi:hypothetical protein
MVRRQTHVRPQTHVLLLAARFARGLHDVVPPKKKREQGMAGARCTPRSRVQKCAKKAHTSIQVQRRQSAIPCAMVLRLMPCSPRRRIRLVTVAAGLMADTTRLDRVRRRQLGTSNGCRDHTVLPYASASFVLRAVNRSRCEPPCDHLRTDAVASTASHPAFVTTRDPPLLGDETARAGRPDLPDGESEKFFARGLDRFLL